MRIFLLLLVLCVPVLSHAADVRKKDMQHVIQRALGEMDRTSGWCDSATETPANIWASSEVPAELKTTAPGLELRRAIRWLYIYQNDRTNPNVPMCVRIGPNTDTLPTRSALTCVGTSGSEQTNGQMFGDRKDGRTYLPSEFASATTPTLFVRSSTGSVRYCVEVAWKA